MTSSYEHTTDEHVAQDHASYEVPQVTVIGAVSEFTLGLSGNGQDGGIRGKKRP